jgi:hypothetical protein
MITFEAHPGLFIFQFLFTFAFTGVILWQARESLNTLNK